MLHRTFADRVVVGHDGSQHASIAAEWAARRAEALGVGLVVLSILPPLQVPRSLSQMMRESAEAYTSRILEASRTRLDEAAEVVRSAHPGLDVEALLVDDSEPAVVLVEASRSAQVVVTGARGIGTAKVMALGSVSRHLVTHAEGLVAVIPETGLATDHSVAGTVVVGVHDAARSHALPVAAAEAERLGGPLVVVHTWENPYAGIDGMPATVGQPFDEVVQQLGQEFEAQVRQRLGDSLTVPLELRIEVGHAGEALVDHAHRAELVVVGTRAKSRLSGMMLGSTAIHVLKDSISSVLVVPSVH